MKYWRFSLRMFIEDLWRWLFESLGDLFWLIAYALPVILVTFLIGLLFLVFLTLK
jgi:hypothetical protein